MFLILLLLWLIFSGAATLTNLLLGAAVSALVTLFCAKFMGYDSRRFYGRLKKAPQLAFYLAVLVKEMVYECYLVIRFIWRRGQPDSMLVRFRSTLKSEGLRVLVANSITLTPGTYTARLEGDEYAVHALDESFQPGIEYNEFFQMARTMEES